MKKLNLTTFTIISILMILLRLNNQNKINNYTKEEEELFASVNDYKKNIFQMDAFSITMKAFLNRALQMIQSIQKFKTKKEEKQESDNMMPLVILRTLSSILSCFTIYVALKIINLLRDNKGLDMTILLLFFDNTVFTHFGLINIDTYQILFMLTMIYHFLLYRKKKTYINLLYGGLSASMCINLKLKSLLTISLIVVIFFYDLYSKSLLKENNLIFGSHSCLADFCAFFTSFMLLPILSYVLTFYVYFKQPLVFSDAAYPFSIRFQSSLESIYLESTHKYVVDRGYVTLVSRDHQSYLKSESKNYDEGSKQQIVYGEEIKSEYSVWQIVKIHVSDVAGVVVDNENDFYIKNGNYVRFIHIMTDRYLHSHEIDSKDHSDHKFKEVSCYGNATEKTGDENDYWIVESNTDFVQTRNSELRFKHVRTGRYLGMKTEKGGEPGINEIYTSVDDNKNHRIFYIEDCKNHTYYEKNFKDEKVRENVKGYSPLSFKERFIEYHIKLMSVKEKVINNFKAKSFVWEWPLLKFSDIYKKNKNGEKISKNEVVYKNNPFNTYLSYFIIILWPFFYIINRMCIFRGAEGFKITQDSLFLYLFYLLSYLPHFFGDQKNYISEYFISYFISLILVCDFLKYFIGVVHDLVISISFAYFSTNVDFDLNLFKIYESLTDQPRS